MIEEKYAQRIMRVADAIERESLSTKGAERLGFNMNFYGSTFSAGWQDKSGHSCNTVACIAGHTYVLFNFNGKPRKRSEQIKAIRRLPVYEIDAPATKGVRPFAKRVLGLDDPTAEALFEPKSVANLGRVTPAKAVKVLRHYANTGKVNWRRPRV